VSNPLPFFFILKLSKIPKITFIRHSFSKKNPVSCSEKYFIGVFDNLSLVKQKLDNLITTTNSKRSDYIIKSLTINNLYNYDWSHNEEDEIKNI
jgi:hypothetical protein